MRAAGADYNFLCGILRSREAQLLNRARTEAMVGAREFAAAVAQVPEGPFSAGLKTAPGAEGIEAGCRAELAEVKLLLARDCPSAEFSRLVFLPWDFHNLKVAVLEKLKQKTGDDLFGPEGEAPVAGLRTMAEAMEFRSLPRHLLAALERAWIAYHEEGKDSQVFELALDRQKQLALRGSAAAVSHDVMAHVEAVADISIAASVLRARFADMPFRRIAYGLEGHADFARLRTLYPQKLAEWGGRIPSLGSRVLQRVFLAVNALADVSRAVAVERRARLEAMRDWRYRPPSAEYTFFFFTRKLADIFNLRLILLAVLKGVGEEEVRGRLNDAFV